MRSKKSKIIKEIDPQDVKDLSQARIDHYLSLGYLPYLDENDHVKWLTQAQSNMRAVSSRSVLPSIPHRIFQKKPAGRRRRKRGPRGFLRFIQKHLFFIIAFLIVLILLILAYFIQT